MIIFIRIFRGGGMLKGGENLVEIWFCENSENLWFILGDGNL